METKRTGAGPFRRRRTYTARQVVPTAAALGTQTLLHSAVATGRLPEVSPVLGHGTRTNSEAILYPRSLWKDADYSRGVAITFSFHPDEQTHARSRRFRGLREPGGESIAHRHRSGRASGVLVA